MASTTLGCRSLLIAVLTFHGNVDAIHLFRGICWMHTQLRVSDASLAVKAEFCAVLLGLNEIRHSLVGWRVHLRYEIR